jgi:hypothetical protein
MRFGTNVENVAVKQMHSAGGCRISSSAIKKPGHTPGSCSITVRRPAQFSWREIFR